MSTMLCITINSFSQDSDWKVTGSIPIPGEIRLQISFLDCSVDFRKTPDVRVLLGRCRIRGAHGGKGNVWRVVSDVVYQFPSRLTLYDFSGCTRFSCVSPDGQGLDQIGPSSGQPWVYLAATIFSSSPPFFSFESVLIILWMSTVLVGPEFTT